MKKCSSQCEYFLQSRGCIYERTHKDKYENPTDREVILGRNCVYSPKSRVKLETQVQASM